MSALYDKLEEQRKRKRKCRCCNQLRASRIVNLILGNQETCGARGVQLLRASMAARYLANPLGWYLVALAWRSATLTPAMYSPRNVTTIRKRTVRTGGIMRLDSRLTCTKCGDSVYIKRNGTMSKHGLGSVICAESGKLKIMVHKFPPKTNRGGSGRPKLIGPLRPTGIYRYKGAQAGEPKGKGRNKLIGPKRPVPGDTGYSDYARRKRITGEGAIWVRNALARRNGQ